MEPVEPRDWARVWSRGTHMDTHGHSNDPTWNSRTTFTRTSKGLKGFVVYVKCWRVIFFPRGRKKKKKKMDWAMLSAFSCWFQKCFWNALGSYSHQQLTKLFNGGWCQVSRSLIHLEKSMTQLFTPDMNCDLFFSRGRCHGALKAPCASRHGPDHPQGHKLGSELLGTMQLPPGSPASITWQFECREK